MRALGFCPLRVKTCIYFAVAGFLSIGSSAHACVASGDTHQLETALQTASNAYVPTVIKLEQGYYGGSLDLTSSPTADLSIVGGYVPTPNHTCAQREAGASNTQISFGSFGIYTDDALIHLEGLTLGDLPTLQNDITIWGFDSNRIELVDVRITSLSYPYPVNLGYWGADKTEVKLTNVQFDGIVPEDAAKCAMVLRLSGDANATLNHVTADLAAGNFCFDAGTVGGNKHVALWNSIFWDRATGYFLKSLHDDSDDPISFEVRDVDFSDFSVSPSDSISFDAEFPSIQVDPQWADPGAGDYSIFNSPATNAGTENNPGGDPRHADIVGTPRPIGSAPDMGAYESPFDDYSRIFTVTNTNDVADPNSPQYLGSLRWALTQADAGDSQALIKFALPACPSLIKLNSPLPNVWVSLTIDGYSSPGSAPNTDPGNLFNGTLCVAIEAANSVTTPSAFIVPSGAHDVSLTVRGVAFGNFSQGIQLWGGHEHQIAGNQFGGLLNGLQLQLFGFDTAAVSVQASAPVIIGGSNPADRNVFLNANSFAGADAAGVLVGTFTNNAQLDCQIIGNLFGVTPNGSSAAQRNENGIVLKGNGCAVLGNYLAGSTKDAIRLISGSRNVVQNNIIGPAPNSGQDFQNPGAGIRITDNANDNIIAPAMDTTARPTAMRTRSPTWTPAASSSATAPATRSAAIRSMETASRRD